MKKLTFCTFVLSMFLLSACEYEVFDIKPGVSLDPVTNVNYSISGSDLTLTWMLPNKPSEISGPLRVRIEVRRDGSLFGSTTLHDDPTSYTFVDQYDSSYTYRIVIKAIGDVETDEPHVSDVSISPGVIVEI